MMLHGLRSKSAMAIFARFQYILVPVLECILIVHLYSHSRILQAAAAKTAHSTSATGEPTTGVPHELRVDIVPSTLYLHLIARHVIIWQRLLALRHSYHVLETARRLRYRLSLSFRQLLLLGFKFLLARLDVNFEGARAVLAATDVAYQRFGPLSRGFRANKCKIH